MKKLILLSLLVVLFSCKNNTIEYDYPENPENIRKQRAGKFFDDSNLFKGKKTNLNTDRQKISSPLWSASIEVIGALLPIAIADEHSGLIVSEWYKDGKSQNDRIKINLLVKGKDPKKENLLLTIFRQTKNSKNVWIDEKSSNQSLSSQMIKDKIIEKAQF